MRFIALKIFLPFAFMCMLVNTYAFSKTNLHSLTPSPLSQPTITNIRDSAEKAIAFVKQNNAWIDAIGIMNAFPSSFGMRKSTNGIPYELVFYKINFTKTTAQASVFAKVTLPQRNANGQSKALYFQGQVTLARSGGLIAGGKLQLIGNDTITSNKQWSFILNGFTPGSNSDISKSSYFEFDCSGYQQLGLQGTIALSANTFLPVNTSTKNPITDGTEVKANFSKVIAVWDSLYVSNVTFSAPFAVKNIPQYIFTVNAAAFDFNNNRNPDNGAKFSSYINNEFDELPNTWKGLSFSNIDISLPQWFKTKASTNRVSVNTNYAVLDETGFTSYLKKDKLISLNQGDAHGWGYSVDSIEVEIERSALTEGYFKGKILLPIENKDAPDPGIAYAGNISDSTYTVVVGANGFGNVKAEIWKANLEIDKSSTLSMPIKNGQFYPKIVLSGAFGFHSDGTKTQIIQSKAERKLNNKPSYYSIDDVVFEELVLQSERPFINAKSFSAGMALKVSGFEASVALGFNKVKRPSSFDTKKEYAAIDFTGTLSFMEGKFAGGLGLTVFGEYDTIQSKWTYHSTLLNSVAVSADFGKIGFSGAVDFFKDDTVYGNGFSGAGSLKIADKEITASLILGNYINQTDSRDSYQYWSADASVRGLNLNLNGIIIDGFSGGASYHMDPVDIPNPRFLSGVTYKPSKETFLRLRAGIFLKIASQYAFSGWAGLEFAFYNSMGLKEVSLTGVGQLLSNNGIDQKNTKIGPNSKGKRSAVEGPGGATLTRQNGSSNLNANSNKTTSTTSNPILSKKQATHSEQPNGAFMWGDFSALMDIENERFTLEMDVYANYEQTIVGAGAESLLGSLDILISNDKWHIYVGTKEQPNGVRINASFIPANVRVTSYFDMGNDINAKAKVDFALMYGFGYAFDVKLKYGIFYANASGNINFDMYVQRAENFTCNGKPAGIYGWYGKASLNAHLGVVAGLSMPGFNLLGYSFPTVNEELLRGDVNANLEIRGPNPVYFAGDVRVSYRIGYSLFSISGDYDANITSGTYCKLTPDDPEPRQTNAPDLIQKAKDEANHAINVIKETAERVAREIKEAAERAARAIEETANAVADFFDSLL